MDCPFLHAMEATPKNEKEKYDTFFSFKKLASTKGNETSCK